MKKLGVWMWPQSVERYGAEVVVQRCSDAGISDIFFLAKGLAGTTAFHGAHALHFCTRDLLRELLDAAHQRGIRVHAWFTSACDENYKRLYPESGRCHFLRGKDRELISLADEGYLRYLQTIISDVCKRYEVDGLHLDYIRYNHMLYGWAEEDMARYKANGADIIHLRNLMQRAYCGEKTNEQQLLDAYREDDAALLAFAKTRREDVVRFARTMTETARAEKPSLLLSAALMPEGAYQDTAFADLHYGQCYSDAAQLYGLALPMAYSQAYGKDAQWVCDVARGTMEYGIPVLTGVHAYAGGTGETLRADVQAMKSVPESGVCLFRYGAFAMAHSDGKDLRLCNTHEESITRVTAACDGKTFETSVDLAPGQETILRLPFEADALRVYRGEEEKCVCLDRWYC